VLTTGVFALDNAAGGGVLYNLGFSNGTVDLAPYGKTNWEMSRNGFGAFGFFGLGRSLEFNIGFLYKNPNDLTADGEKIPLAGAGFESTQALQFGIYWKHPIPLNEQFVIFPTAGVDYELTLGSSSNNSIMPTDWWDDLWLRAGVGLDTFFSETMFVRSHLIYGAAIPIGGDKDLGLSVGHGLLVKVGIGFMF